MTTRSRSLVVALLAVALVAILAGSARAAWPGADGPILFRAYNNSDSEGPRRFEGIWSARPGTPFAAIRKLKTKRYDMDPQVSPDGRLVVFSRYATRGPGLYRMNADGSRVVRFTGGLGYADTEASFAPSGKRVVFSRCRIEGEECPLGQRGSKGDIYSIRLDGSGLRRLTSGLADDRNPTFSPNGRLIAFERGGRVFTMWPDGSRQRNITRFLRCDRHAFEPDFSPDGSRIAFINGIKGFGGSIYTVMPNGSSSRRLSPRSSAAVRSFPFSGVSYSPSGRWLVAVRDKPDASSSLRHELQVLDARTGRPDHRKRFHTRGRVIYTPVWAPQPR
jgi:Tol biopolymer transport system component